MEGAHPIGFAIVYYEEIGSHYENSTEVVDTAMATILDIEEMLQETFTFVAPVSKDYIFWFAGYYSDKLEGQEP